MAIESPPPSLVTGSLEEMEELEMDALEDLKKLMLEDEVFKKAKVEDELLLIIIRARRCKPDAAFKTIQTLLEYKNKKYPELFEKAKPQYFEPLLPKGMIGIVKRVEDKGPAIIVFRTQNWNTREASMDELIMMGLLYAYEVARHSLEVQRQGIIMIIDVGGFGFSHARQCTYGSVMKMANCIIFASPFRIASCSVINCPYVFDKLYQVVKFAVPERYRSYVTVTKNDLSHLHKQVSPDKLPVSLGGLVPEDEGWETGLEDTILADQEVLRLIDTLGGITGHDLTR